MKKSDLKTLIKEVVQTINELVGEKPEIGQFRWNYEIKIEVHRGGEEPYERVDVSKWSPILAKDENEAKEKALAPYNPKVVTVKSVKMIKDRPVTQTDIDQYNSLVAGYAHEMRPKSQGGWGAAEEVINEVSSTAPTPEQKQFRPILQKVKSLIDKSPEKASLKALVKNFQGEPLLELRAYGLPMGSSHGFYELEDEFGDIVRTINEDIGMKIVEVDESNVGGKQFKYALFSFPQSGVMPNDDWNIRSLIGMGR